MDKDKLFNEYVEKDDLPRDDLEKQIILKKIMEKFEFDKIYNEMEVSEIIKEFFSDFPLIRRELVNFGYMQRDPYKGEYQVIKKELNQKDLDKIKGNQDKFKKNNVY
ncbi:DUF2087 domain-containing protein [Nanoarchaeota archaeon]